MIEAPSKAHDLVEAARQYIGIPWCHQGRNRLERLDCIGLLVVAAQDVGLPVEDDLHYDPEPDGETLRKNLARQLVPVSRDDIRIGCVLAFRRPVINHRGPRHVALVTGTEPDTTIIHTYADVGRVTEHIMDPAWWRLLDSAWRFADG